MNIQFLSISATLTLAGMVYAQAPPTKIAVIHIQRALIETKDGQKAASGLQAKFEPRKKSLEAKQSEVAQLQGELNKGSNTMAEARRVSLTRDIDQKTKSLQRDTQDAQDEFEQEQNKILNQLGQQMMVVIDKYAKDNSFAVVIDISSQQTPVLWAANSIDITNEIIQLYDKNSPSNISETPASKPATPSVPAAVKPTTPVTPPPPPTVKKQPGTVK